MSVIKRSSFLKLLAAGAMGSGGEAFAAKESAKPASTKPKPAVKPPPATEKKSEAPAALESLCAAIEPSFLKTETARPFAEGRRTVIAPARELVDGLDVLSAEEFKALGVTWEQFLKTAAEAATRLLVTLKPELIRDAKGSVIRGVLKSDRHITPGIILSKRFPVLFEADFGDRVVALIPDRFTVHIFPRNFSDFQKFGTKTLEENTAAVWPCSVEAFEISKSGVKCLGSFDDGE